MASSLALACGIGAAAVTWSLLSAVLLRPLPVEDPERLMVVGVERTTAAGARVSHSHTYAVYQAVRDSGAFERVVGVGPAGGGEATPGTLLVEDSRNLLPQLREVDFASYDFFDVLGVRLPVGTGFGPGDDRRGAPLTAVISHRYWREAFDADPMVVGRTVRISGLPATIVGVTPPRFRGLSLTRAPDIYLPLDTRQDVADEADRTVGRTQAGLFSLTLSPVMTIVGRLDPEGGSARAMARLEHLQEVGGSSIELMPISVAALPEATRPDMMRFARLLSFAVGLVLLIGCLTVGMLLLVRTEGRRNELAVCLALGATRGRLARGIALEGALLAVVGTALALPIAWMLLVGLRAFELPGGVRLDLLDLSLGRQILWAAGVGGAVSALFVALIATGFGLSARVERVIGVRRGATPAVSRRRTRTAVVAAQIAVTLVLVTGAGLFTRSLMAALGLNPAVESSRLFIVDVSLFRYGYTLDDGPGHFFEGLRDRLVGSPAVQSVALASREAGMAPGNALRIDGIPYEVPTRVSYLAVDDRYFSTMGLPVVRGRGFSPSDAATGSGGSVVVVSESFGRLFADGDPVGRTIDTGSRTWEIVGVVSDIVTDVNVTDPLIMYYPLERMLPNGTVVVQAAADPRATAGIITSAIREIDPLVRPAPPQTLDEVLLAQVGPQRFGMFVLGTLGGIAVLLSALGVYVVAATMTAMRRREMGVRAALGATRAQLGWLVLADTARLVALGLAAGLVLVGMGAGTIRALLYQVEPLDVTTIGTLCALLFGLALLVSLRPAIDAARVDLMQAIRDE